MGQNMVSKNATVSFMLHATSKLQLVSCRQSADDLNMKMCHIIHEGFILTLFNNNSNRFYMLAVFLGTQATLV